MPSRQLNLLLLLAGLAVEYGQEALGVLVNHFSLAIAIDVVDLYGRVATVVHVVAVGLAHLPQNLAFQVDGGQASNNDLILTAGGVFLRHQGLDQAIAVQISEAHHGASPVAKLDGT